MVTQRQTDPYPKFGPDVETDGATHTPRGYESFIIYIIDVSGEQVRPLKQALNGLSKQGKETGLGFYYG